VVALVSCSSGLIMARPPSAPALLLLPATALLTASKGLATSLRRSGQGAFPLTLFLLGGAACAAPAAIVSPVAYATLVGAAAPFALLYFAFADSPRWTRSLAVEAGGTLLLATVAGLPILASRPESHSEAAAAWLFFGLTFLPGVLRARIPKDPSRPLRVACSALALASLGVLVVLVLRERAAWWTLVAAPPILKEAYRAWAVPDWTTRQLGINLTLKAIFVGLVVSIGWRGGG
jgi:hypothetical protein